jgi:hypothetical protein
MAFGLPSSLFGAFCTRSSVQRAAGLSTRSGVTLANLNHIRGKFRRKAAVATSAAPRAAAVDFVRQLQYNEYMSTTVTIRADRALREALERRAKAEMKTVSGVVREILEDALTERPLEIKAGHLKGALNLASEPSDPWRKHIRARNWRT